MIWLFEIVEIGFSDQINTKGPNEFDKARPETVSFCYQILQLE